jgi:hypothetical protein
MVDPFAGREQAMEERELLRRYALAISLIPDADAAADIFMESAGESDLRRRAALWRARRGLTPPDLDAPLPALDAIQQEHALDLVRRAALRRRARPWLAGGMAAVLLLSLEVVGKLVSPANAAGPARAVEPPAAASSQPGQATPASTQIVPLKVAPQGGRVLPAETTACRKTALVKSEQSDPMLVVTVPYATQGDLPTIASAVLHVNPGTVTPSRLFVDVRATPASDGAPAGCYLLLSAVALPESVRGRQVEFVVTVRPGRVAGGATWSSDPVWAP